MRLPLVISGRPSFLKEGARVSVPTGKWKIVGSLMDTEFDIIYERIHDGPAGGKGLLKNLIEKVDVTLVLIEGPCIVQFIIRKPGTERYLDVYLEAA